MNSNIDFTAPASQHNPFVAPEGYFANFSDRLMQQIYRMEQTSERNMRIVRWIPFCGTAAVAALFVAFVSFSRIAKSGDALSTNEVTDMHTKAQMHEYAEADYTYDYFLANDMAILDYASNE